MKKLFTILLLLIWVGGLAQTKDTTLQQAGEIGVGYLSPNPALVFGGGEQASLTLMFHKDSIIFDLNVPMNEAAKIFLKATVYEYSNYVDSLTRTIKAYQFVLGKANEAIKQQRQEIDIWIQTFDRIKAQNVEMEKKLTIPKFKKK